MFSEENYVPKPQIELASMLTAFYCVNDQSIISRKSMHKHNFGQTLKLQSAVVNVNISSWSLNLTIFCLQTTYLCKFGAENPTDLEDRAKKRLILQFFKDDLEMR